MAASPPPPAPKIEPMKAVVGEDVVDGRRLLVDVVGLPVGVDAVGVGLRVADDLLALLAVLLDEQLLLLGDEGLGLGAGLEGLGARDEGEGVEVGDVGDGGARRAAAERQQEPAIAGGHPAGAEREVLARLAGDVRDAPLVVDDLRALAAGLLLEGSRRSA